MSTVAAVALDLEASEKPLEVGSSDELLNDVERGGLKVRFATGKRLIVGAFAFVAIGAIAASHLRRHNAVEVGRLDATTRMDAEGTWQLGGKNTRRHPTLKPQEDMHDGNKCDDSEEEYGGLCYAKCGVLTQGSHPFRKNAFSCCKTSACGANIFEMKVASIIPCHGYDVSLGHDGSTRCPHGEGACLNDEEMFMDECYEKCSDLTANKFPHRVAAATCCNADEAIECLNPFNDVTGAKYDVGGGAGDNDRMTPAHAHPPLLSVVEGKGQLKVSKQPAPTFGTQVRRPQEHLKPEEKLRDGNKCDDSEEEYGGLCYAKCSILTHGSYPFRGTAFSCCKASNCRANVFKMKVASIIPCHGYDVSLRGDGSTRCPHGEGACLDDEEMFMGECYEKCSILTNSKASHRVGAASCCSSEGFDCMNPFNDVTARRFDVGGGKGDHDVSTPALPHGPLVSLTEV